eukprot:3194723-Rhodomonas_salina.1
MCGIFADCVNEAPGFRCDCTRGTVQTAYDIPFSDPAFIGEIKTFDWTYPRDTSIRIETRAKKPFPPGAFFAYAYRMGTLSALSLGEVPLSGPISVSFWLGAENDFDTTFGFWNRFPVMAVYDSAEQRLMTVFGEAVDSSVSDLRIYHSGEIIPQDPMCRFILTTWSHVTLILDRYIIKCITITSAYPEDTSSTVFTTEGFYSLKPDAWDSVENIRIVLGHDYALYGSESGYAFGFALPSVYIGEISPQQAQAMYYFQFGNAGLLFPLWPTAPGKVSPSWDTYPEHMTPTCVARDECLLQPCPVGAVCIDTLFSYSCDCGEGFTAEGGSCVNVDECAGNITALCGPLTICVDTEGSFQCGCAAGAVRAPPRTAGYDLKKIYTDFGNTIITAHETTPPGRATTFLTFNKTMVTTYFDTVYPRAPQSLNTYLQLFLFLNQENKALTVTDFTLAFWAQGVLSTGNIFYSLPYLIIEFIGSNGRMARITIKRGLATLFFFEGNSDEALYFVPSRKWRFGAGYSSESEWVHFVFTGTTEWTADLYVDGLLVEPYERGEDYFYYYAYYYDYPAGWPYGEDEGFTFAGDVTVQLTMETVTSIVDPAGLSDVLLLDVPVTAAEAVLLHAGFLAAYEHVVDAGALVPLS